MLRWIFHALLVLALLPLLPQYFQTAAHMMDTPFLSSSAPLSGPRRFRTEERVFIPGRTIAGTTTVQTQRVIYYTKLVMR